MNYTCVNYDNYLPIIVMGYSQTPKIGIFANFVFPYLRFLSLFVHCEWEDYRLIQGCKLHWTSLLIVYLKVGNVGILLLWRLWKPLLCSELKYTLLQHQIHKIQQNTELQCARNLEANFCIKPQNAHFQVSIAYLWKKCDEQNITNSHILISPNSFGDLATLETLSLIIFLFCFPNYFDEDEAESPAKFLRSV